MIENIFIWDIFSGRTSAKGGDPNFKKNAPENDQKFRICSAKSAENCEKWSFLTENWHFWVMNEKSAKFEWKYLFCTDFNTLIIVFFDFEKI